MRLATGKGVGVGEGGITTARDSRPFALIGLHGPFKRTITDHEAVTPISNRALSRSAVVDGVLRDAVKARTSAGAGGGGAFVPLRSGISPWLLSVDELADAWRQSPSYATLMSTTGSGKATSSGGAVDYNAGRGFGKALTGGVSLPTNEAQTMYGRAVPVTFPRQVCPCVWVVC